jgi:flagella basal body P-ring formation protein FlgA
MIDIANKLGACLLAALLTAMAASPADAERPAKETPGDTADMAILHEHVIVKGNIIRLGDIFSNAGDNAHVSIAYAPAPGKRLTLDVHWLYRAASAYKLKWKPFSLQQQAIVERDSIVFTYEDIKDRIHTALSEHGIDKNAAVEVSNRLFRLHAPNEPNIRLKVEDLAVDVKTGRFTALLSVAAGTQNEVRHHVTGWIRNMTSVPVLARRIGANETIKQHDVKWVQIRSDRMQQDFVTKPDALIGMSSKRVLGAGEPVRLSDIRAPILVSKGSLVTMEMKGKFMRLTARGRALDDGSKGDVIRVSNAKSKKEIEAVVVGSGRVSIDPHGYIAMK